MDEFRRLIAGAEPVMAPLVWDVQLVGRKFGLIDSTRPVDALRWRSSRQGTMKRSILRLRKSQRPSRRSISSR
jgi:hypothetical protein